MTPSQGPKHKEPLVCPCLRDIVTDDRVHLASTESVNLEEDKPIELTTTNPIYCKAMGKKLLEPFDLRNKCVGLYRACDMYLEYNQQDSSGMRRRKQATIRSSLYGALGLL